MALPGSAFRAAVVERDEAAAVFVALTFSVCFALADFAVTLVVFFEALRVASSITDERAFDAFVDAFTPRGCADLLLADFDPVTAASCDVPRDLVIRFRCVLLTRGTIC